MVLVHATILGGLPVVADVWFSGPDYFGEYDSGVDGLYWQKSDGSKGKELSDAIMQRLEKYDTYWQASVTEQANDWLSIHCPVRIRQPDGTYSDEGEWSPDYILLNGKPKEHDQ